jgi:hypothetical protein
VLPLSRTRNAHAIWHALRYIGFDTPEAGAGRFDYDYDIVFNDQRRLRQD